MRKCSLCGGDLDRNKRCVFCGLDNTKNDDLYKHLINQNDCSSEPLTHVHTEPVKTQRVTQTAKPQKDTPKSGAAKVFGIIALIATLGSSIFELVESLVLDGTPSYSEEGSYDLYEYVGYDLPETGMEYTITLEPGIYTVGVHIPEGTYEASVVAGDYGMVEIRDYNNSIYMYENIGELDEATVVSDLRLYRNGHFVVSNGIKVELYSTNVQSLELFTAGNTLTESVTLIDDINGENYVAGLNFPMGVYDIIYAPSSPDEYGSVEYTIPMDDYDSEWSITFGETGAPETYHNVVFTKGARVYLDGIQSVTLVPSETVAPTDINEFYDTFQ